jgi:hypothetical protein
MRDAQVGTQAEPANVSAREYVYKFPDALQLTAPSDCHILAARCEMLAQRAVKRMRPVRKPVKPDRWHGRAKWVAHEAVKYLMRNP